MRKCHSLAFLLLLAVLRDANAQSSVIPQLQTVRHPNNLEIWWQQVTNQYWQAQWSPDLEHWVDVQGGHSLRWKTNQHWISLDFTNHPSGVFFRIKQLEAAPKTPPPERRWFHGYFWDYVKFRENIPKQPPQTRLPKPRATDIVVPVPTVISNNQRQAWYTWPDSNGVWIPECSTDGGLTWSHCANEMASGNTTNQMGWHMTETAIGNTNWRVRLRKRP